MLQLEHIIYSTYISVYRYIIFIKYTTLYNIYYVIVILLFCIWWSPFIPSRNLDEVFTYNHIWL